MRLQSVYSENSVTFTTLTPIKEGQSVLHYNREDYTNTEYLLQYGELFEDYNEISYQFVISMPEEDPNSDLKRNLWGLLSTAQAQQDSVTLMVKNSSDPQSFWPLYSAVRIKALDDRRRLQIVYFYLLNRSSTIR